MGVANNEEWRGEIGKMTEDAMVAFLSTNPFYRLGSID
jgi:hypothetical protein